MLKEEIANTASGGGIDFNKDGRNKYSAENMYKRSTGMKSFKKWLEGLKKKVK
jgi:hypothetical protein|tara:strand:+ start:10252 stop:10410 length:159 start_codon:yes stop_codon:yes gene_type:complete